MGTGTRGSNGHPGLDREVTNIQPLQQEIHQLREEVKRLSQSADWSRSVNYTSPRHYLLCAH
jgi:hypothetical protein